MLRDENFRFSLLRISDESELWINQWYFDTTFDAEGHVRLARAYYLLRSISQ